MINTTPCLLVNGLLPVSLGAVTSWYGSQATQHSSERDHGIYVTARGSSCCVYEKGEEHRVVNADIGCDLGDAGVYQGHAKLRGEVN